MLDQFAVRADGVMHSSPNHVGGEIRGQIKNNRGDEDEK